MASLVEVSDWKRKCDPFSYLGLVKDCNGVDIEQSAEYIQISYSGYIDRVLRTHKWDTPANMKPSSKNIGPLPADAIQKIYKESGPAEGTAEHQAHQALNGTETFVWSVRQR